jgi:protein gp37
VERNADVGHAIAWTDPTFNPSIGCLGISDGCRNCYPEGAAGAIDLDEHASTSITPNMAPAPAQPGKER